MSEKRQASRGKGRRRRYGAVVRKKLRSSASEREKGYGVWKKLEKKKKKKKKKVILFCWHI